MKKIWYLLRYSILVLVGSASFSFAPLRVVHAQLDAPAALLQAPAGAAPQAAPVDTTTATLTLTPQGEPVPALRYRLLPTGAELRPGNAVPFYYRAILELKSLPAEVQREYVEKHEAWHAWPFDESKRTEIEQWLAKHQAALEELRTAVYREECEWDFNFEELRGTSVVAFRLEDMHQMRSLARILQLKARLEISQGRFDDALETLRTGYRLAEDVARPPLLVSSLIGIAIGSMMHGELEHLITEPKAPNMYWALTTLPPSFGSVRNALEFESQLPEQIFPLLKDPEAVERTPEEWQRLLEESFQSMQELGAANGTSPAGIQKRLALSAWLVVGYPAAKQALIDAGYDTAKIEAMPVGQVVAIHTARSHKQVRDNLFKWSYLPFRQAIEGMNQTEAQITRDFRREVIPVSALLLPAVKACVSAEVRGQRRVALLRAVEAIRMHAAQTGALPDSLDQVNVVPVPSDPLDLQPFTYQREGDKAVLELRTTPSFPATGEVRRYVLELRK